MNTNSINEFFGNTLLNTGITEFHSEVLSSLCLILDTDLVRKSSVAFKNCSNSINNTQGGSAYFKKGYIFASKLIHITGKVVFTV
jgi:hypothetical protein